MGITLDTLNQAFHSVAVGDGTNVINLDGSGNVNIVGTLTGITNDVNIADGGNSITVDAADLDIRDLSSVSDSVSAVQSGTWDIGTVTTLTGITNDVNIADGGNSITVDAVDLDIRDLSGSTDSVNLNDGTNSLDINADGSLNVTGTFTSTPGGYATWQHKQATATTTASQLDATALAGRINCIIQNLGSQDIYWGSSSSVTTSNGMLIPKGSSVEIALDDTDTTAENWIITSSGTATIAFAEYAP